MSRPSKLDPHAAPPPAAPPAPASAVDAPSRGYTDFILRSTAPSSQTGIKYNIMKFAAMSDRSIDPADEATFPRPVRLNRKDPRTVRRMNDEEIERINRGGDELMEDGTVVKGEGEDVKGKLGKKVKEEMDVSLVGTGTSGIKPTARSKGNMFKKKTNRVFVSSEEARRLKREEWMPWVLEDASSTQRWIGRLEGGTGEQQKSSSPSSSNSKLSAAARSTAAANAKGTGMSGWRPPAIVGDAGAGGSCYVAFVFPEDGMDFKVYPANRWYKFGQGPKYVTLGTEDAEEEYNRQEKKQASERWIMQRRAAESTAASKLASGSATPAASASPGPTNPSVQSSNARARLQEAARQAALQISGARAMRTGGKGGSTSNRPDQSEDEFDFEEDFQDDEEGIAKIDDMADEDELKELNRRIKNEMRGVERIGMSSNAAAGEEEGEGEGEGELDKEGRQVRKLFKRIEKNDVYDSDGEEENPYASQGESSSDDSTTSTPSTTKPKPKSTSLRRSSHSSRNPSRPTSRTGSPAPGLGNGPNAGAAMLAKRATSPSGRRSTPGSRSNSPGAGREGSAGGVGGNGSGKRRRGDGGMDGNESDGSKRRKAPPTPDLPLPLPSSSSSLANVGSPSSALITEGDIIALFKMKATSLQTKDVLAHFKKALKGNPANKAAIGGLLMSVASLVDGNLILRPGL